jgi:hypothetical protein
LVSIPAFLPKGKPYPNQKVTRFSPGMWPQQPGRTSAFKGLQFIDPVFGGLGLIFGSSGDGDHALDHADLGGVPFVADDGDTGVRVAFVVII